MVTRTMNKVTRTMNSNKNNNKNNEHRNLFGPRRRWQESTGISWGERNWQK
jgi:hypothetical protein